MATRKGGEQVFVLHCHCLTEIEDFYSGSQLLSRTFWKKKAVADGISSGSLGQDEAEQLEQEGLFQAVV